MKKLVIFSIVFSIFILSGCVENDFIIRGGKRTHVCYGVITDMYVDGTMASLDLENGSVRGITFFPSPNEGYECFDFELLEVGAVYTFVFHIEDNVPRPGIDIWYRDDCPVIDEINRGNYSSYWVESRGCVLYE
ncbi:MAG: hypothetical protein BV457_05705 [Thermoplasmata archaeon M9B1D]|nr:MAG: hypothetical protein BV457_05705 [Thermoplasmata archaeon M9B1D]PNX49399.1 MAG: hypothetical protein BV456_09005 [Thermoplasmata archaeon M8B2D]